MALTIDDCPCGEPVCPGITTAAVLNFGDFELFSDVTNLVTSSQVLYDPADYPGQTSTRFRGRAIKEAGVTSFSFSIVDELGTVYLTPTMTFALQSTGNYEAEIDEVITLDGTSGHTYYLKTTAVTGGFIAQVVNNELWVFMVASDIATFQIPLGSFNSSTDSFSGITNAGEYRTASLTYVRISDVFWTGRFKKDANTYADVDYWKTYIITDSRTGTGALALFNVTKNLMVTGTESVIAKGVGGGVSDVYSLTFSNTATNFDDDDEFEFRAKYTSVAGPTGIARVMEIGFSLYVKIGNGADLCAIKTPTYIRNTVSDCEDIYLNRAFHYRASDWPVGTVFYFEMTFVGVHTYFLKDTGTLATPIDPPTNVGTLVFPAGTSRQRTVVTFTDDHYYTVGDAFDLFLDVPAFIIAIVPEL